MLLVIAGRGDREQRGDRPALDDLEAIVDEAPFDVLGAAEVRFDPPAQLGEPHDLRVRQRRLLLTLRLDRLFPRPACRRGVDRELLGGDRLGDDLAVTHLVDVRVHEAGDQGLAEAEAGLHGGDLPVGGDGVGREQDAGRLRKDHLLHDHGHVDLPMLEAVPQAVGHRPLGEERGPAPRDVREDRLRARRRSDMCRAGPRRRPSASPPPSRWIGRRRRACSPSLASERVIAAARSSGMAIASSARRTSALSARIASRSSGLRRDSRSSRSSIDGTSARIRSEGVRRHAEAGRHADAFDPRKLPQVRALAANDRDPGLIDLPEIQHVAAHPTTSPELTDSAPLRFFTPAVRSVASGPVRAAAARRPRRRLQRGHRHATRSHLRTARPRHREPCPASSCPRMRDRRTRGWSRNRTPPARPTRPAPASTIASSQRLRRPRRPVDGPAPLEAGLVGAAAAVARLPVSRRARRTPGSRARRMSCR